MVERFRVYYDVVQGFLAFVGCEHGLLLECLDAFFGLV